LAQAQFETGPHPGSGRGRAAAMGDPGEGQRVFVKNTFLDLEDGPRMPALRRWRTMPAEVGGEEEATPGEGDDDVAEDAFAGLPRGPGDDAGEGFADGSLAPPMPELKAFVTCDGFEPPEQMRGMAPPPLAPGPPDELYRTVTCDGFEDGHEWSWAGGDPNQLRPPPVVPEEGSSGDPPASAPPGAGPSQMTQPAMFMPAVVGMVMVPAEVAGNFGVLMPPGAAPPPLMMPGDMPPDHVAVPVGPFTRWPTMPPPPGAQEPGTANADPAAPPAAVEASTASLPPPLPAAPRAPVLTRVFSVASYMERVRWTVDARKLKSTDREAVSPSFDLSFSGVNVQFKMVIRPKVMSDSRGGASFKKAKGRGSVELRCLSEVEPAVNPIVTFRLAIGSGADPEKREPPRGPVRHDFTQRAICGLPEGQAEWDFSKAVDEDTLTFVVCLEILAGSTANAAAAASI